jgi:hypothetical protein
MMITVLQQDLKVHYNHARINSPDFSNSQDVFIHGMIDSDNGGTCASMPVLYTAVARRLGYPVFLVNAKEHVFCRWDGVWRGATEKVNIEGAGEGGGSHPDSYYMKWPHPISQQEVDIGCFLRSLDPWSTLAECLAGRAYVLEDNGDLAGAHAAYVEAAKRDTAYSRMAASGAAKKKTYRPDNAPPLGGDPTAENAWNQRELQRLQQQQLPTPPPPRAQPKAIPGPYDR